MTERRPPRWNIVSVCTPFVGYLVAAVVSGLGEELDLWHHDIVNVPAILIVAAFCVFGLVAGGVALFRNERLWGLAALGIVLNAPLPLLVLFFVACEVGSWFGF
jgi:hypothetical protein